MAPGVVGVPQTPLPALPNPMIPRWPIWLRDLRALIALGGLDWVRQLEGKCKLEWVGFGNLGDAVDGSEMGSATTWRWPTLGIA